MKIKVEDVVMHNSNTRFMTSDEFNLLCEDIKEHGMMDPILVVGYHGDGDDYYKMAYKILDGNHRFRVVKDVLGQADIEAIEVGQDWSNEEFDKVAIKLNMLRGHFDSDLLTKAIIELRKKRKIAVLKKELGMAGQDTLVDRLFQETIKSLPKEKQRKLEAKKEKIKDIADLRKVTNEVLREDNIERCKCGCVVSKCQ